MSNDQRIIEIQLKAGVPAWTNSSTPPNLSSLTTSELREWCELKGMPTSKSQPLPREILEKCYYTNQNYFNTVAGNRPRNLGVRKGSSVGGLLQQMGNDWTNTASSAFDPKDPPMPANPVIDTRTKSTAPDPVKELLETVNQIIDRKIQSLKNNITQEIARDLRTNTNMVLSSIKSQIESGEIKIELGKSLETKIQDLVQKTADEIIFQSLARPKGVTMGTGIANSEENREPEENELEPELDLTNSPSSPFVPKIDPYFYIDPFVGRAIRKAITLGRNVYASGDTGCGKTATFLQVCAVLNRGIIRLNPHDGITKESLVGGTGLRNGETFFQYGALPTAMKEGLPFLLDEADYLPPNLAAVFNPITERGGKLFIPETGETIEPSPGFCVFATANTGGKGDNTGQYSGTEVLNTAWLDRFPFKIKMDYLPKEKEYEMLAKRFPKIEQGADVELQRLTFLARDIRLAFSRGELSITLSTRKLIDYFEQRENGFSQGEALSLCLLSWLDDDDLNLVKTMMDRLQISAGE